MGKRFLVSRLSSLGDVVCTLPVAAALKRTFPDSHITWVVDSRFAGVVECCTAVDEIVRAKLQISPASWPSYKEPFEAALDMQGLAKSALCIAKAKATRKLGYHWQREGSWLFSARVLPDPSSFHVVDQYVDVARAAGAQADFAEFALRSNVDALTSVKEKLAEAGIGPKFVVMNPGAGWITKRWPPEHFGKLIEAVEGMGLRTVLIGGNATADHAAAGEVLQSTSASPVNLTGKTNIKELIALIDGCSVHVGGDTGSTHIAAALGKSAVGLYSITRPERSCPYGQIQRCHYNADGLFGIKPEEVFQTVKESVV